MNSSNETVNIIIDCSGSMIESGKRLIARSMLRQIEQYLRLGYASCQIRLFACKEKIEAIDWNPDQEYPDGLFECCGTFGGEQLAEAFQQSKGRFLLLTDCLWDSKSKHFISNWAEKMPPDNLRIVKIGNDPAVKITNVKVFCSEDILAAIDQWVGA